MASMLEVLREYKHLSAQKKRDGALSAPLEARLAELDAIVRVEKERKRAQNTPPPPRPTAEPRAQSRAQPPRPRAQSRAAAPRATSRARPEKVPQPQVSPPSVESTAAKPESRLEHFFADPRRRRQLAWSGVIVGTLFSPLSAFVFGLTLDAVINTLVVGVLMFAVGGWGVLYPALMWWRERAAGSSTAHLSEPDFVARSPVVEPVVGALTGLGGASWLMLGDYSDQGLAKTIGMLFGMGFGLVASGAAAILIVRPIVRRRTEVRAFVQYIEAGTFNLNKNNARRARRMYEHALDVAKTPEQQAVAKQKLQEAANQEAADLENRGYSARAKELLRNTMETRARPIPAARSATPVPAASPEPPTRPRLIAVGGLDILGPNDTADDPEGTGEYRESARALERRGRHREAFESLIDHGLSIPHSLAKDAATEYIGASMIRSADAIYEAIGERQIPEFYKAVAVEWSRADSGFDPAAAVRLAKILWDLDEGEAAVRVASQGALSAGPRTPEKRAAADLAEQICGHLEMAPPPEIVESLGRIGEAAELYTRAGRAEDALRCWRLEADRMIDAGEKSQAVMKVLSKLFIADKYLDDRYLTPLVDQIIASSATGGLATRILAAFRSRHRDDAMVSNRLFELYLQSEKRREALDELAHLEALAGSTPEAVLRGYEALRTRFPDDTDVVSGLARAMVRCGKAGDATGLVMGLLTAPNRTQQADGLIKLIDGLIEWGRADVELRRERAFLNLDRGDVEAAMADLEAYVTGGGRNPEAVDKAVELLSAQLVGAGGKPNYAAHMRLARFHLFSGSPQAALAMLEVARMSDTERDEADLLLGRAELASSNPRRSVQILRDAIDGRHPQDAPELHFELARAFEILGDLNQAKKIDTALDHFVPGFVEEYIGRRASFDRSDTIWMPTRPPMEGGANTEIAGNSHELSLPAFGDFEVDEATSRELELEDALQPRYKLIKRLGSGGMGDVHLAEDLALGREVAIKVLRRSLATDLFISKFKDEARIVAQLSHPGIVGVFDIGQRGAWSYIVMEYVPGPNLATLVHATMKPTRAEILEFIAQVADAMQYAHTRGVIHRDLKPANILVTTTGVAKVTDFGIARILQGDSEETAFSAAGLQVGTINYMAPEQIRGSGVDERTDIYLLGTTLYYSLTLQYPYIGDAVAVQKLRQDATPLTKHKPDVSKILQMCVAKSMARDPGNRFGSMREFAKAIREVPELHMDADRTELA